MYLHEEILFFYFDLGQFENGFCINFYREIIERINQISAYWIVLVTLIHIISGLLCYKNLLVLTMSICVVRITEAPLHSKELLGTTYRLMLPIPAVKGHCYCECASCPVHLFRFQNIHPPQQFDVATIIIPVFLLAALYF